MATQPILDLSTERERFQVRIDGVLYDLRARQDLTLREYRTLEVIGPQIVELEIKGDQMTDEDAKAYAALLDRGVHLALDAPDDVIAKLDDVQRRTVFRAFLELLAPALQKAGTPLINAAPVRPAGTKSSPASSGSTAATRRRGKRTSRSA